MTGERKPNQTMFHDAEWYDRTINWPARIAREIPVLVDVFGPPAEGGILDAGCGTGHEACALAARGYRVVGADASDDMLSVAGRTAKAAAQSVDFVLTPYADLHETVGGGFDGVYCIGNSLAAAGTREAAHQALAQFGKCLRAGGRLFIQVLNFELMRSPAPCVRGPRIAVVDGTEHVSTRTFHFGHQAVQVTNTTLWRDNGWQMRTHTGTLYPITLDELSATCKRSNLRIDHAWGGYGRQQFAVDRDADLLIVATRETS